MVLRHCNRCKTVVSSSENWYEITAQPHDDVKYKPSYYDLCPRCHKDFIIWMRSVEFQREMEAKDGHN